MNVLVVDDETDILDVIGQYLTKHGYHTDLADSVERAIDCLHSNEYEIILTDKNMPDSAGRMRRVSPLNTSSHAYTQASCRRRWSS